MPSSGALFLLALSTASFVCAPNTNDNWMHFAEPAFDCGVASHHAPLIAHPPRRVDEVQHQQRDISHFRPLCSQKKKALPTHATAVTLFSPLFPQLSNLGVMKSCFTNYIFICAVAILDLNLLFLYSRARATPACDCTPRGWILFIDSGNKFTRAA